MPTAKEYRLEAKACLKLADKAKEPYVKESLIELAEDYNRAARQAERGEPTWSRGASRTRRLLPKSSPNDI